MFVLDIDYDQKERSTMNNPFPSWETSRGGWRKWLDTSILLTIVIINNKMALFKVRCLPTRVSPFALFYSIFYSLLSSLLKLGWWLVLIKLRIVCCGVACSFFGKLRSVFDENEKVFWKEVHAKPHRAYNPWPNKSPQVGFLSHYLRFKFGVMLLPQVWQPFLPFVHITLSLSNCCGLLKFVIF